jgi:hypothetical protein
MPGPRNGALSRAISARRGRWIAAGSGPAGEGTRSYDPGRSRFSNIVSVLRNHASLAAAPGLPFSNPDIPDYNPDIQDDLP